MGKQLEKSLHQITKDEAIQLCKLVSEPYLNHIVNDDGKWDSIGLEIRINTTSTSNGDNDDSYLTICKNGKIELTKNNGNWEGFRQKNINTLPLTDYLRKKGYEFKY